MSDVALAADEVIDDFDRLLAAHLDDTLDAAEAARFHERLRADAEARRLLLAAATQASALPRLGLEAETRTPRTLSPVVKQSSRWWWVSAAAAIMLFMSGWWFMATVNEPWPANAGVVVERGGRSDTTLRLGDLLTSETESLIVRLLDEDTRIELAPGSRLRFTRTGARKHLFLETGTLHAVVAPQPTEGGLQVTTPHGLVDVVGTSFSIEIQEQASRVAVTHGTVRVGAGHAPASVPITAGYAAEVTVTAVSSPGPAMVLPPRVVVPVPSVPIAIGAASSVRITAADFTADAEGEVVSGVVRGIPIADGRVTRLTTPSRRPGGYARLSDHLRCTVRLTVDRPTTLALLLVCDQPTGEAMWSGNLQAERAIPAGTHEIVLTSADFRLAVGALPAVGSRVIAASVMCWSAAADLRMESLTFTE